MSCTEFSVLVMRSGCRGRAGTPLGAGGGRDGLTEV